MARPEKQRKRKRDTHLNPEKKWDDQNGPIKWLISVLGQSNMTYISGPGVKESYPTWAEQDKEFSIWLGAARLIKSTAHFSDEEFKEKVIPRLKKWMERSPMFAGLMYVKDSGSKNTFEHIFKGLSLLRTAGLLKRQVIEARLSHLFHDLFKVLYIPQEIIEQKRDPVKTIPDYSQLHGLGSAKLVLSLFEQRSDRLARIFASLEQEDPDFELLETRWVIYETDRLHHLGQQLESGTFTILEFINSEMKQSANTLRLVTKLLPVLLSVTAADSMSVPGYEHYSWGNVYWLASIATYNVEAQSAYSASKIGELIQALQLIKRKVIDHWNDLMIRTNDDSGSEFNNPENMEKYRQQFAEIINELDKNIAKLLVVITPHSKIYVGRGSSTMPPLVSKPYRS